MAQEQAATFRIEALDKTARIFNNVDKRLDVVAKSVGRVGKSITQAVTLPALAVGVVATKISADFDKSMREVNSLLSLPEEGFKKLKEETRALSNELGTNLIGSTQALYQAISAGVPEDNAISFLKVASKTAIAGVTDTMVAVDGLTTVLNAFKLPATEVESVADIMFTTVKRGKTTMEELSNSMFQVAPIASSLGVEFGEVSAAVATLTKSGTPTSVAMTQLRQAMVALTKPNEDLNKLLKKAGIESVEASIKLNGLQGTYAKLQEVSSKTELAKAVGSVEALGAVLGITGDNAKVFKDDLDSITNSAGAMNLAFQENDKGVSRALEKLQAKATNLAVILGDVLAPYVSKVADLLGSLADTVSDMDPDIVALGVTIVGVGAAIGGLLLTMGLLLKVVGTVTGAMALFNAALVSSSKFAVGLRLALTGVISIIGKVGIALRLLALSNPFTAIALGVTTVAVAAYGIYQSFKEVEKPLKNPLEPIEVSAKSIQESLAKVEATSIFQEKLEADLEALDLLKEKLEIVQKALQTGFYDGKLDDERIRKYEQLEIKYRQQIEAINGVIAAEDRGALKAAELGRQLATLDEELRRAEAAFKETSDAIVYSGDQSAASQTKVRKLREEMERIRSVRAEVVIEVKGVQAINQAQAKLETLIATAKQAAESRIDAVNSVSDALAQADEKIRLSRRTENQELKETEASLESIRKKLKRAKIEGAIKGDIGGIDLKKETEQLVKLQQRADTLNKSLLLKTERDKAESERKSKRSKLSGRSRSSAGATKYSSASETFSETFSEIESYEEKVKRLTESANDLLLTDRQRFQNEINDWKLLYDERKIDQQEFERLREVSAARYGIAMGRSFELIMAKQDSFLNNMTSAIDRFVDTGKFAFGDFATSVIKDLARIEIKAGALKLLGGIGDGKNKGSGILGGIGKILGYEGGGFTGNGTRSGGVDGRGGFPAILHPNETVIDHTKGQGMGGNITIQQTVVIKETVPEAMAARIAEAGKNGALNAIRQIKARGGRRAGAY